MAFVSFFLAGKYALDNSSIVYCVPPYIFFRILYLWKLRHLVSHAWFLLGSDRALIRSKAFYICFISLNTCSFQRLNFYNLPQDKSKRRSWNVILTMHDQFTAVNILFTLGPVQVCNTWDHCTMAILVRFWIINERLSEIFDSVKRVTRQGGSNLEGNRGFMRHAWLGRNLACDPWNFP